MVLFVGAKRQKLATGARGMGWSSHSTGKHTERIVRSAGARGVLEDVTGKATTNGRALSFFSLENLKRSFL